MDRTELFNKLESMRHITPGIQTSLFYQVSGKPGVEYWCASELQKLCGVKNMPWRDTKTDMQKSMINLIGHVSNKYMCDAYAFTQQHIIPQTGSAGKKYDMKMSRYASWVLAKENVLMPFMRAYFMIPGADVQTLSNVANAFARINACDRLTQCNHHIAGIMHKEKIPFNRFYANMHGTFFGAISIDDIKKQNGIKIMARDSIHNYMNIPSMNAMSDGIDATIYRYNNCKRHNLDTLSCIVIEEMRKARRQLIEKANRTPVMDITKISIKDLRIDLRKMESAFIKKYQNETLR